MTAPVEPGTGNVGGGEAEDGVGQWISARGFVGWVVWGLGWGSGVWLLRGWGWRRWWRRGRRREGGFGGRAGGDWGMAVCVWGVVGGRAVGDGRVARWRIGDWWVGDGRIGNGRVVWTVVGGRRVVSVVAGMRID